ncbi:T9SS type A sorting domain-containing protein [Candidatus Kaistella beijingensis]|uniref:T9SS type A sorting domain-containing protein n=1 Tax=Candidatus Kaistella beijingensis TaxID=2820270 RepID=UPI001CC79B5E|nr:T9SS type A sorting domain-containing protein [Candidatus Kaistella beijingensis]UBB90970.1 T9SS type A sorting domain-containing protein [Candidatus Kaistella beijingensis]
MKNKSIYLRRNLHTFWIFIFFTFTAFPLKAQTTIYSENFNSLNTGYLTSIPYSGWMSSITPTNGVSANIWGIYALNYNIDGNSLMIANYDGDSVIPGNYRNTNPDTSIVVYRTINTNNYGSITINFNWKADGERSRFGTYYDYGQVVYRLGTTGTWIAMATGGPNNDGRYYDNSTTQSAIVSLPSSVDNTIFQIGFRWNNDNSTRNQPGFVIDNIVIKGITACTGTPSGGTISAAVKSFCDSGSTTISASGYTSGFSGITYQWQSSTDGTTFTNIGTASSTYTNYTTPTITQTTWYRLKVNCSFSASTAYSDSVAIIIGKVASWANINSGLASAVCSGTSLTPTGQVYISGITEAAGQGVGVSADFGYSTTSSDPTSSTGWTWVAATFNLQNGNNDEFKYSWTPTVAGTYNYTFRFKSGSCGFVYGGDNGLYNASTSPVRTLIVDNALAIANQPVEQLVCGTNYSPLTIAVTGSNAAYQWYEGSNPVGNNSNSYTPTKNGTYHVTVTNSCGMVTSSNVLVTSITYGGLMTQSSETGYMCAASEYLVYGQVYQEGITTATNAVTGPSTKIEVQFGYGTGSADPSTWPAANWTTFTPTFNAGGGGTNNDEYVVDFRPTIAGTYYYTYRFRNAGCSWYYVGYSASGGGQWNGTTNISGVVTVGAASTYNNGWDLGTPNGNGIAAIIKSDYDSSVNGSFKACNCTVDAGATLTIGANSFVEVLNNITNTGNIVVESNGNLIQINDSGTFMGNNIMVKRNSTMKRLDYTYWGTPVDNQQLKAFSPLTVNSRFYRYNEIDDSFTTIANSAPMVPGKGYVIRAPDNFSPASASTFVGTFTGKPNNGLIPGVPVTYSGAGKGRNLIGNPYPSNINLDLLKADNVGLLTGTFYFWTNYATWTGNTTTGNGTFGSYNGNGYASYSGVGGVSATTSTGASVGPAPSNIIKVGQGFLAEVAQNGSVQFKNHIRTELGNAAPFFNKGTGANNEKSRFWLNLITPIDTKNTVLIGYVEGGTNGYDAGYDAIFPGNGNDQFFMMNENKRLLIQGRQYPFADSDVVTLGMSHFQDGNYTISLGDREGVFAGGQAIYLKDNQTGIITNLSEASYTYTSVAGLNNNRFEIIYKPGAVLATDSNAKDGVLIYRDGADFVVRSDSGSISTVEVFDTSGRMSLLKKSNSSEVRFPAADFVDGIYVVNVILKNGDQYSKKIRK